LVPGTDVKSNTSFIYPNNLGMSLENNEVQRAYLEQNILSLFWAIIKVTQGSVN